MRKEDHLIALGLGTEFCVISCLGLFAGYFADKKLESFPLFTLIGGACGFSLALYTLIKTALNLSKKLEKNKK